MTMLSRKCVPFTPFEMDLSGATLAIVTAAAVYQKDREHFNVADDLGDLSFRVMGEEVESSNLMVTH